MPQIHPNVAVNRGKQGFTLIELLVVVAIIVVLLALLIPAMDKAIYQAELAVCGANIKAAGSGVTVYAFDHKRYYPYRPMVRDLDPGVRPIPQNRMTMAYPTGEYDDRPVMRNYINVKKMLLCPLSPEIDLEVDLATDTSVFASYNLFFGWQYTTVTKGTTGSNLDDTPSSRKGMFRMGDKFGWNNGTFSTIIADYNKNGTSYGDAVHPDKAGLWASVAYQHEADPQGTGPGQYITRSWYTGVPSTIDLNFGQSDNSVLRYNDIHTLRMQDSSLKQVPSFKDAGYGHMTAVPVN